MAAALIALVVGLAGGYALVTRWRIVATLRRARVTPLRDVRDGVARVTGRLGYAGEPLVAPLTGRRCAYYEVWVEQPGPGGSRRTILHQTAGQDFCLRDDTGKALVEIDGALFAVVKDAHTRSGTGADKGAHLEAMLARHQAKPASSMYHDELRYREGVLEEGEHVSVLGKATWEPDPEPGAESRDGGYREPPMRLVFSSPGAFKLLVSDDPAALPR